MSPCYQSVISKFKYILLKTLKLETGTEQKQSKTIVSLWGGECVGSGVEVGEGDVKHLPETAGNTAAHDHFCKTCKQAWNTLTDNEPNNSLIIAMDETLNGKNPSYSCVTCLIQKTNRWFQSCVAAQVEVFLPHHMTVLSAGNKYLTKWPAGVLTC